MFDAQIFIIFLNCCNKFILYIPDYIEIFCSKSINKKTSMT